MIAKRNSPLPLPRPAGEGAERSEAGEGSPPTLPPHSRSLRKADFTKQNARQLRAGESPPEAVLWKHLRTGRLKGFKFRRQHPTGPYVLDFYCQAAGLALEIDGSSHRGDRKLKDAKRDAWLTEQGVDVFRVTASQVSKDLDAVLRTLLLRCQKRTEAIEVGRMQKQQ